jgi:uncharacterized protein YbjT (DUF2867 family)
LLARGDEVVIMSRSEERARSLGDGVTCRVADACDREQLRGLCEGADVVISCLGASLAPVLTERRGYREVDLAGNLNLLAEARKAGVKRFVYVSVFSAPGYADTVYVRAHHEFEQSLRASGISHAVVRPTGMFSAFGELLELAARGRLPLIGGGAARTNPVHEREVAQICLQLVDSGDPAQLVEAGGPEVLSRREIARLAMRAAGVPPRFLPLPRFVMKFGAWLIGLVNPRVGELLGFVAAVSTSDCVAEAQGTSRLADYFDKKLAVNAPARLRG